MIEIITSKYCYACAEYKSLLDANKIPYIEYEGSESNSLIQIANDDGYTEVPLTFFNKECIGSGISVFNKIQRLYKECV